MLLDWGHAENIDPDQLRLKEMYAVRVSTPPVLDGILDDEAWKTAVANSHFLQWRPYNLAAPAEETEVRVIYDDNYIYVGVNCIASQPERIVGRMGRRDNWQESFGSNSDWVVVAFDANNDARTGHHFLVNTVGSRMDIALTQGGVKGFDPSWDAV